jgi:hypothetical protein
MPVFEPPLASAMPSRIERTESPISSMAERSALAKPPIQISAVSWPQSSMFGRIFGGECGCSQEAITLPICRSTPTTEEKARDMPTAS